MWRKADDALGGRISIDETRADVVGMDEAAVEKSGKPDKAYKYPR